MTTTLTAHEPQDPDHLLAHAFDDRDVDLAGGADGAMELTSIPPLPPRTS